MTSHSGVQDLLGAYRARFQVYDAAGIADLFTYP